MKSDLFAQLAAVVISGRLPLTLEGAPPKLSPCDLLLGLRFTTGTDRTREPR